MKREPSNRSKRLALILSGATDALIGFGFLPVDVANYGLPAWLVILVGAFMFIMGAWVAAYNYSRIDE